MCVGTDVHKQALIVTCVTVTSVRAWRGPDGGGGMPYYNFLGPPSDLKKFQGPLFAVKIMVKSLPMSTEAWIHFQIKLFDFGEGVTFCPTAATSTDQCIICILYNSWLM